MNITVIQTADALFYQPILEQTSRTVRAYCTRYGLRYESFVGIKRGTMPWHASYNRVYMLKEMLDRGVSGWVLYLDADGMIVDHEFDFRAYLEERSGYAAIFAGHCVAGHKESINSGGFAINLSHPVGASLVRDYHRKVQAIPDREFDGSLKWNKDINDDQGLLQLVLQDYIGRSDVDGSLLFEHVDRSYVNYGPFISQALRTGWPSFADRRAAIGARAEDVMARLDAPWDPIDPGHYVEAAHPRLASEVGRKVAGAIRTTGRAGGLLFGPYIDLAAGKWTVRVFGAVRPARSGAPTGFGTDVVTDAGQTRLSFHEIAFDGATVGVLATHNFDLAEPSAGVEVRVVVDAAQDMEIFAVHFANSAPWIDWDV